MGCDHGIDELHLIARQLERSTRACLAAHARQLAHEQHSNVSFVRGRHCIINTGRLTFGLRILYASSGRRRRSRDSGGEPAFEWWNVHAFRIQHVIVAHLLAERSQWRNRVGGLTVSGPWTELRRLVVCERADHGNRLLAVEWQHAIFVLQKHKRLERQFARDFAIFRCQNIRLLALRISVRMIEQSCLEFDAKHSPHCFIYHVLL